MRRSYLIMILVFVAGLGVGYFVRTISIGSIHSMETHAVDLAAIEKLHKEDIEVTLAQDPKGLLDIWTEDGVRFNPGSLPAVGKQAIEDENQKVRVEYPGFKVLRYVPKYKNIQIENGLACESFERDIEFKLSPDIPATSWRAKGLQVLKQQSDGSWKFAVLIAN
jgi:ketosteroid isomerase-like protein